MNQDTKYLIFLTALYFAVSLVGILHHEFFIDEAHHWLLARDSTSVSELIQNTRIEGHPLLWTFLLYGITRFTTDPFWMQFLHIIIATTTIIIFLRKAPFTWLFKTLFIFGYFMVFEYNLISRNYGLGILFLFLASGIFQNREQKFSLLCLYLALASNSHLVFSVIALALFLTLLLEQIQNRNFFTTKFITGYLIFGFGLFLIYIQIHTTDSGWLLDPIGELSFQERILPGFGSFFKGIVAIPDFRTLHFWNSNLIVNWSRSTSGVLALLIYLLPLVLFFKNRKTLFFVYTALIGAQVFFFVTQRAAIRFHGMTFILIILGLWVENYYTSEEFKLKRFLNVLQLPLFRKPIIYGILLLQFSSGIYAYSMDIIYPFSSAKETVTYIKNNNYDTAGIITVTCDGTLLSAYLQKKIYFLCNQNLQSFCHWDCSCSANITQKKNIEMLTAYMDSQSNNKALFVSYYSLSNNNKTKDWITLNEKIKVRLVKEFNQNIVEKTNYYLFEVSKIKK